MSRRKNAAELCALLVEETYGELSSRIFISLLRRGRLTIPALAQYTRLPIRHLRRGLAVLVQQNLVYYHVDGDTKMTHYEANQGAAHSLLRSGKIIEAVQSRYGPQARKLVQNLLFLGHSKVEDLIKACRSKHKASQNLVNGHEKSKMLANRVTNGHKENEEDVSISDLDNALLQLLDSGIIVPVVQSMFQSPSDIFDQIQKEILRGQFGGSTKGPKQKDELQDKINERLREVRSEEDSWQRKGAKRALNGGDINGGEKRRKLANGEGFVDCESHGFGSESNELDRKLIVRINYDKCAVILRNQQLVSLAARELGKTSSLIYEELLRVLENHIPRCKMDPELDDPDIIDIPTVSTMEVGKVLGESINPESGIGTVQDDKIDQSKEKASKRRKRKFGDVDEGDASSDEQEDDNAANHTKKQPNNSDVDQDYDTTEEDPSAHTSNAVPAVKAPPRRTRVTFEDSIPQPITRENRVNRMSEIENHLNLLKECSPGLVKRCGGRGLGEWVVNFESIVENMKEVELDTFIFQSFGQVGSRIVRILRQKGKLDEKQIQKFGLLSLKDVRTKLLEMQMAGIVDIQEVPKDTSRAPARTLFFWYFDADRAAMIVLEGVYKTISRCLQVLNVKKREQREVLSLAQRTDIRGQEEQMLSSEHLATLRRIREKEEKIFTLIGRLDELVGIFRDF